MVQSTAAATTTTIVVTTAAASALVYYYYDRVFCKSKKNKTSSSALDLIRPNIRTLKPYRCARDDYDSGVLLDANENSYGPPLKRNKSSSSAFSYERYPCPYQNDLKSKIASFRSSSTDENDNSTITSDNIFLGVGSDEAIDLAIRIFCTPSTDSILITSPTYGMYSVCAAVNDVNVLDVPLLPETFQLDTLNIIKTANSSKNVKIIFLCNPGNPTASLLRLSDIISIYQNTRDCMIVVDEAYIDFTTDVDTYSCVPFLSSSSSYDRLIVLQTMSKGFGLAGIRLGMAFGNPDVISVFNSVKAPYNINIMTSDVASNALTNIPKFKKTLQHILSEKERVVNALQQMAPQVSQVYKSDTNFILFKLRKDISAYDVYKKMAETGVVIRYRGNQLNLSNCLRATVGTSEENDQMLSLLFKMLM